MKKDTKVAMMQTGEKRTHSRRAVVRNEAKGNRKVAREKTEHVGLVAKQHTLQRGVERETTKTCTQLMKLRVKTLQKHLTTMKSCKRVACWKKMNMSSGKS